MHIQYRSRVPKGVKNLLVAGCASGGGKIFHAATGNMACCAIGEQRAENATALSIGSNLPLDRISLHVVQKEFKQQDVRYQ
jgi:hypothetical protein